MMSTKIFTGISVIALFALFSIVPDGILDNQISVNQAQAYYGSYSAGNVQATGRVTTRGTGTIGGHTVTYYPYLPGSCIELKSEGVIYYNCDGDYYRPYYLGNQIVYVMESP